MYEVDQDVVVMYTLVNFFDDFESYKSLWGLWGFFNGHSYLKK